MAPVALDGLRFVMSDFERALSEWRSQEACKSSLSPCELDELEDHLRARVDLELELDVARAPSEAFALACEEVGDLGALSKEFARAGAVRWRRLLRAGWALFGVSCFLPLWTEATWPYLGDPQHLSGLQAFSLFLAERGPLETVSALTNLVMVVALFRSTQVQSRVDRMLAGLLFGSAAYNFSHWLVWIIAGASPIAMGVGYWAWLASFACVATGLRLRAGERASVEAVVKERGSNSPRITPAIRFRA